MRRFASHLALPFLVSLATLTGVAGPRALAAAGPSRPGVLIILADDLGYSDLGCYGGEISTPHLDRLAEEGLRYTQFYNTARCWPTRAAILTGYYAQQVRRDMVPGVRSGGRGVRPAWARLLPELLETVGYRSYHSGKWHVDGMPLEEGFDRSYYLGDQSRFFSPRVHFEDDRRLPAVEPGSGYYGTIAIADHAIRQLKLHSERHRGDPFFLYLAFTAPHFPLHALPEDIALYRERYRRGWAVIRAERYRRQLAMGIARAPLSDVERGVGPPYHFPEHLEILGSGEVNRPLAWEDLTDEQREFQATKMAIHAAMVHRMDREIGRVLDQLRAMGALDDTLTIFLSDNGASAEIMVRGDGHDPAAPPGSGATHLCLGPGWSTTANTPLRRHKTWTHEGGISTPCIVHWPRAIPARGELRGTPGHVVDLVPTLLEVCGAGAAVERLESADAGRPSRRPGRSLVPSFAADASVERDSLWWLHEGNRGLRVGDWKIARSGASGPWELYDLKVDRTETNDLAERLPRRAKALAAQWERQYAAYCRDATRDLPAASRAASAAGER